MPLDSHKWHLRNSDAIFLQWWYLYICLALLLPVVAVVSNSLADGRGSFSPVSVAEGDDEYRFVLPPPSLGRPAGTAFQYHV